MSAALTMSNNGQKYHSWKGDAKNAAVPVWSKPDPTASGPDFKARPINHYRRQLVPTKGSGSGNSAIGMPMDLPGGAVSLGTADCNDVKTVLKTNIANESDRDKNCYSKHNSEKRFYSASTIIDEKYYTDNRAYLRARCQTFDQNSKIGEKAEAESTVDFKSTNCYGVSGCKNVIYKPNNKRFATQGAVSSGSRLLRLKVETITRNANSLTSYGHAAQNAGRYNGNSTAPYFQKSKENKRACFRRNGKMTMCL